MSPGEKQMERIKVVVRYNDGRVLKGSTHDFYPNKDRFHLFLPTGSGEQCVEISLKDLKAVFLVRDFAGDPEYAERKKYSNGEKHFGRKLEVTFLDGELLVGTTLGYDRNRPGFFILPADPKSNNVRIFVVVSAVKQVRQLG
jgi:hypothetical protein